MTRVVLAATGLVYVASGVAMLLAPDWFFAILASLHKANRS